jgi:hypothetical protein
MNDNNTNAQFVHNNKTHKSTADAFRGADYASWFESDPEMSDMKLFCSEMLLVVLPLLFIVSCLVYGFYIWLEIGK